MIADGEGAFRAPCIDERSDELAGFYWGLNGWYFMTRGTYQQVYLLVRTRIGHQDGRWFLLYVDHVQVK